MYCMNLFKYIYKKSTIMHKLLEIIGLIDRVLFPENLDIRESSTNFCQCV